MDRPARLIPKVFGLPVHLEVGIRAPEPLEPALLLHQRSQVGTEVPLHQVVGEWKTIMFKSHLSMGRL